jgi:low affinity Fe/Cu permease
VLSLGGLPLRVTSMAKEQNHRQSLGCWISEQVATLAANPIAQVGLILLCAAWFAYGLRVDILTAALSILAITLTQMVLNRQDEKERVAHRRDVALHAKLDELLHASRRARDELAGIEELEEEQIAELRENGNVASLPSARSRQKHKQKRKAG